VTQRSCLLCSSFESPRSTSLSVSYRLAAIRALVCSNSATNQIKSCLQVEPMSWHRMNVGILCAWTTYQWKVRKEEP
jgi:hypothetical protein